MHVYDNFNNAMCDKFMQMAPGFVSRAPEPYGDFHNWSHVMEGRFAPKPGANKKTFHY